MDSLREKQIREILDYDKNISRVWFERELKQARAYDLQYEEDDEIEKDIMFRLDEHISDLRSALQAVIDSYASGEQIDNSMVSAIFTQYNTTVSFLKNYLNSGHKVAKRERIVIDEKFQELVPLFDQTSRLLAQEGNIHNKTVMDNIADELKNRQYVSAFDFKRIGIPVDELGTPRNMGMISPNGGPADSPKRTLPQTPMRGPRPLAPDSPASFYTPGDKSSVQRGAQPLAPFVGRKTGIVNAYSDSPEPAGTPRAQSMPASAPRQRNKPDRFQPGREGKGKIAERYEPFQAMSSVSTDTRALPSKINKKKPVKASKGDTNVDKEFNGSGTGKNLLLP